MALLSRSTYNFRTFNSRGGKTKHRVIVLLGECDEEGRVCVITRTLMEKDSNFTAEGVHPLRTIGDYTLVERSQNFYPSTFETVVSVYSEAKELTRKMISSIVEPDDQ